METRIVSKLTAQLFEESNWRDEKEGAEPKDALRAVLLFLLFGLSFASAMFSTFLKGEWARSHILSFISCTGGGVFLGACLLDLLPDSIESFEKTKLQIDFPLPLAFVAFGFLLVLTIDQAARVAKERNLFGANHPEYHSHSHNHEFSEIGSELVEGEEEGEQAQSRLGAVLLVCALSVHALFEGLSLAVTSNANQLLQIFGALVLHKCIMGFCLGVRLIQSGMSTPWVALGAFVFSVQVLIGGLAGIGIMRFISGGEQSTAAVVASILQVIPHELHNRHHRLLKLFFIYVGFFIVVAFILVFPEAS